MISRTASSLKSRFYKLFLGSCCVVGFVAKDVVMRLRVICESRQWSGVDLEAALGRLGVKVMSRGGEHVVSFVARGESFDKCRALVKRAGWLVHSRSVVGDRVYVDVTPLRNVEYESPSVLFHITDRSKVDEVLRVGLSLRSETPHMSYPRRVYLYPSRGMAVARLRMARELRMFANKPMLDPVLLRVDNSSGKYPVFIDPENHMGMGADAGNVVDVPVYTSRSVDPVDISVEL